MPLIDPKQIRYNIANAGFMVFDGGGFTDNTTPITGYAALPGSDVVDALTTVQTTRPGYPISARTIMAIRGRVIRNTCSGLVPVTLMKNGVDTNCTFTIPGGSAANTKFVDLAHPIVYADGDDFDIKFVLPQELNRNAEFSLTVEYSGAQGPVGLQGPPGAAGGPIGPVGPPGQDGESGEDSYIPGPPGLRGETGLVGLRGADGEDGEDSYVPGPMGPPGSPGKVGPVGDSGPSGLLDIVEAASPLEILAASELMLYRLMRG